MSNTESSLCQRLVVAASGHSVSGISFAGEAAERNYGLVIDALQCNAAAGFDTDEQQIACLTAKDAAEVVAASGVSLPCRDGCAWAPVIDGAELTDWPINMVRDGHRAMDKPIIQVNMSTSKRCSR